ncbi:MAG TPA: radical SAM protein [Terracidiphilus sp.]|nr:radical SAM protein [Terracidiphilus sp.]
MSADANIETDHVLGTTESLCPVCLERIEAQRVAKGDAVYLRKKCHKHGEFETVIWRGLESYGRWGGECRTPAQPPVCGSVVSRGCPFDCGLCPEHRQHTCCVVLDVTERCNLACPVCFASAGGGAKPDPSIDEIVGWCRKLIELGGPFNLHLSGGEPTVRRDLPEIIRRVRALGFSYIQLNTNGVRLALEVDYAQELKDSGLTCVFLQFDGTSDDVYQTMRGKPLLETKLKAIANCGRHELGVVLVPTLAPRVNTFQIGDILRTAISLAPAVRAVHFQPISYFGRYPAARTDVDRVTFPEVIRHIEEQTGGVFKAADFYPASGENPYCSFHGKFWLDAQKKVSAAPRPAASSCCGSAPEPAPNSGFVQLGSFKPEPGEGVRRAQRFVAQHWSYPTAPVDAATLRGIDISSFDQFLANKKMSFCISGMAFQDAWNIDLERLRECFLHVLSPEQKLVPLCAYNLTGITGRTLYRRQTNAVFAAGAGER